MPMVPLELPHWRTEAPQPAQRKSSRLPAVVLIATAAALLAVPGVVCPSRQASGPLAISLFAAGGRPKVLFEYRDYELLFRPRRKGQVLPRVELRKKPPRPLGAGPLAASVEGPLGRDFAGFPFTTSNAGSVQLDFPRIGGSLKLGLEDPATGASVGGEEQLNAAEASYEQRVPGLGDVSVHGRTNGEWGAAFKRQVEDLGSLSGSVNSQLDWSIDLDSSYPAFRGFTPSITYGATQDGMRVNARAAGPLAKNLLGSYGVQNEAGQYAPTDLRHDAKLTLSSGRGTHVLEAEGTYDRKLSQVPVRGSLAYSARMKPVTLEASVDFDRYRLRAKAGPGQVTAVLARKPEETGNRPAEVELKLGKVSATALLGADERLRLGIAA